MYVKWCIMFLCYEYTRYVVVFWTYIYIYHSIALLERSFVSWFKLLKFVSSVPVDNKPAFCSGNGWVTTRPPSRNGLGFLNKSQCSESYKILFVWDFYTKFVQSIQFNTKQCWASCIAFRDIINCMCMSYHTTRHATITGFVSFSIINLIWLGLYNHVTQRAWSDHTFRIRENICDLSSYVFLGSVRFSRKCIRGSCLIYG